MTHLVDEQCPHCDELRHANEQLRRGLVPGLVRNIRLYELNAQLPAVDFELFAEVQERLADLIRRTVDHIGGWDVAEPLIEARIKELKRMPYREYLRTDEWQDTRRFALRCALYRCQLCNAAGLLDVHHRTYERRGEEHGTDVVVLCRRCHARYHTPAESDAQPGLFEVPKASRGTR